LVGLALELRAVVLLRAGGGERRLPALAVGGLELCGDRQDEGEGQRIEVVALPLELRLGLPLQPGLRADLVGALRGAQRILVAEALDAERLPARLRAADVAGGRVRFEQQVASAVEHAERVAVGGERLPEVGGLRRLALAPLEDDLIAVIGRPVLELQDRLERRRRDLAGGARPDLAAAHRVARLAQRAHLDRGAAARAGGAGVAQRAGVAVVAAAAVGLERAGRGTARGWRAVVGTLVAVLGIGRAGIQGAVAAQALDRHGHEMAVVGLGACGIAGIVSRGLGRDAGRGAGPNGGPAPVGGGVTVW